MRFSYPRIIKANSRKISFRLDRMSHLFEKKGKAVSLRPGRGTYFAFYPLNEQTPISTLTCLRRGLKVGAPVSTFMR
jgi:hypothetical protein